MANIVTVKPMSDLTPDQPAAARVRLVRTDGALVAVDLTAKELATYLKYVELFDGKGAVEETGFKGPEDVAEETKSEAELAASQPVRAIGSAPSARKGTTTRSRTDANGRSHGRSTDVKAWTQRVRTWAVAQKMEVSERGRLPEEIRNAYIAANPSDPAPVTPAVSSAG